MDKRKQPFPILRAQSDRIVDRPQLFAGAAKPLAGCIQLQLVVVGLYFILAWQRPLTAVRRHYHA